MDAKVINPVLESFLGIMPQIGFKSVEKKALSLVEREVENAGVMSNIGVTGSLRGSIVIGMDTAAALKVASTMMGGMQVSELDDMAQSAISELSNMVCANACTNLGAAGVQGLNISPPSLIVGERSRICLSAPKLIDVHFVVDNIPMHVYVGLVANTRSN